MDSQLPPAHRHTYEEDHPHRTGLHTVIEGEDENHEKKSVLQKVKATAKKLKDTLGIKKHGHGHDHDHPEVEEDDEEEEEFDQDPDVQGAPSMCSATGIYVNTRLIYLKRFSLGFAVYESTVTQIVLTPRENKLEQSGAGLGPISQFPPLEKDPQARKELFEPSDPGNYQTKATDPTGTGGKEAGVTPLVSSFGKMEISNEPGEHKPEWSSTEIYDQFSSDLPPIITQTTEENLQAVPKSFNAGEPDNYSQGSNVQEQPNQSNYSEKISAVTSMISEKAISAKNVAASKLGYGGNDDAAEGGDASQSGTISEYGRKVAETVTEKLAPVYKTVAEAGSVVVSKMQGTETETDNKDVGVTDKGVSMKEYMAQKLRPSDEDKALSEVISEALHKREGEESKKVLRRQENMTQPPEVVRRVGSDNDDNTPEGMSSNNEDGKRMMDSFKGTS
ncbi:low-temperature-induced 65 kDa protein-like [Telopea speciosissima]|uniref:low-temperature-induced 65 kDa protein-like n=1 Tax=Telopea speciosissima TaxID=54955 RepID=UPI001CC79101|nr:low-temperature-induced 65 kDa protein-like [Telopea speciosissima]